MDDAHDFQCPYCAESLSMAVDLSGGARQSFIYDCEVCCRPIQINLEFEGGVVVSFAAGTDSE